jgi:hypothetical protein
MTRRAFVVNWDNPMPFDLLFDSPHIDWSYPYSTEDEARHPLFGNGKLIDARAYMNTMQWAKEHLDDYFSSSKWTLFKTPWIRLRINRGLIIRSFSYDDVAPRLHSLGFKSDTAFSCLIDYLVRPKAAALEFITQYTSLFALPTVFSVGIQVRTGDNSMVGSFYPWSFSHFKLNLNLNLNHAQRSTEYDKQNTVERHHKYFTCADQIARRYSRPGQRIVYYLISDSNYLIYDALQKFPDKVVVTGLGESNLVMKVT